MMEYLHVDKDDMHIILTSQIDTSKRFTVIDGSMFDNRLVFP